ncbi:MAG: hypothetical protein NC237_13450 [Eubacterium sp.]|nr:hypothetical protein [Eubacterium sp.]MCM1419701.1 hypothetical protein [Roseburia sp.]
MINVDEGGAIRVVRGDTGELAVTPRYEDGEVYRLKEGEEIRFLVYLFPEKPLLEKGSDAQGEDGAVAFYFSAAETDLPVGVYGYRAKLVGSDGAEIARIDTFIGATAGRFEVI